MTTRARPSWSSELGRFIYKFSISILCFLVLRCEYGFLVSAFQNPFWTAKGSTLELGHVRRGRPAANTKPGLTRLFQSVLNHPCAAS